MQSARVAQYQLVSVWLAVTTVVVLAAPPSLALEGTFAVLPSVTASGEFLGLSTIDDAVADAARSAFSGTTVDVVTGDEVSQRYLAFGPAGACRARDPVCMSRFAEAQGYAYVTVVVLVERDDGVRLEISLLDVQTRQFVVQDGTPLPADGNQVSEVTRRRAYGIFAAAAEVGSLSVQVSERGARILIDGEDVGESPLKRPIGWLRGGSYMVEVRKAGFQPAGKRVVVIAGAMRVVEVELKPIARPATADKEPTEPTDDERRSKNTTQTAGTKSKKKVETPSPGLFIAGVGAGITGVGLGIAAILGGVGFVTGLKVEDNSSNCSQDHRGVCRDLRPLVPPGANEPIFDHERRQLLIMFGGGTGLAVAGAGAMVAMVGIGWLGAQSLHRALNRKPSKDAE